VGNVRELPETFPHKAKPFEPGVRRRLREARSEERLEEPDPVECDQPQRNGDFALVCASGEAGSPIGDPAQSAQQGELIRRRLRVVEDDMPE
jgi:hypothetical protein